MRRKFCSKKGPDIFLEGVACQIIIFLLRKATRIVTAMLIKVLLKIHTSIQRIINVKENVSIIERIVKFKFQLRIKVDSGARKPVVTIRLILNCLLHSL